MKLNSINEISDFKDLNEVISESEFKCLLNKLILFQADLSEQQTLEYLEILAEKYEKFWGTYIFDDFEYSNITKILVRLTDYNNPEVMEILTGLLFSFRNEYYFEMLVKNYEKN